MTESMLLTRIGLLFDVAGATLIALDLFLEGYKKHCQNSTDRFGNMLVDTLTSCETEEERLRKMNRTRSPLEEKMFDLRIKKDFFFISLQGSYSKFMEKIENPRRLGFVFMVVGFIFQFLATFI